MGLVRVVFVLLVFGFSSIAGARSLLDVAREQYFDANTAPRIGIEIELAGLTVDKTVQILQSVLGGRIIDNIVHERYIDPETKEEVRYTVTEKILIESSIGNIKVKPEDNVTSNKNLKDAVAKTPLVEIVTAPMTVHGVPALQNALDAIRANGALGTADGFAVAIQLNVEFGRGLKQEMKVETLLNLLRNYLDPENHKNIAEDFKVAEIRKKYLGDYTPGMMKRILDPEYKPTWRQLHFDFMYRQSLELLGYGESAWTRTPRQVKKILQRELRNQGFESILRVIKWNNLRISSLFMFMFPNGKLSRFLLDTTWFHRYPIFEFREPNSDFRILERVQQLVGFVQQSEREAIIRVTEKDQSTKETGLMVRSCRSIFSF